LRKVTHERRPRGPVRGPQHRGGIDPPAALAAPAGIQAANVVDDVDLSSHHRLCAGTLLLTVWLVAAATSDAAFAHVQWLMASWLGLLVLFGFTAALFYHFCNGIRHLAWDAGRGFGLPAMHRSGWTVLAATIVLTVGFWIIGLMVMFHG
jgi:succinate dehydrogenase cytochrome b556 subunit